MFPLLNMVSFHYDVYFRGGGGGYALVFYRDVSTSLQALQALLLSSNVHEKRLKAMDSWNRVTLGGTVFFCSGAKFHLP